MSARSRPGFFFFFLEYIQLPLHEVLKYRTRRREKFVGSSCLALFNYRCVRRERENFLLNKVILFYFTRSRRTFFRFASFSLMEDAFYFSFSLSFACTCFITLLTIFRTTPYIFINIRRQSRYNTADTRAFTVNNIFIYAK